MPNIAHVATIAAYELKTGGFRGVYKAVDEERIPSEVFETLEAAKFWAQNEAFKRHPEGTRAALRIRGEYRANVWRPVGKKGK